MKGRLTSVSALLVLISLSPVIEAQQKDRVWRVGFLSSRARPENPELDYHIGLPRGLKELGYIEGKNLVIEWRYAEGKYERFPELARDLLAIPVDVLVTDGTPSTLAAKKATKTVPIVFGSAGDPVANGLVESLARPGANVTGVALLSGDTSSKQLEMLGAMIPRLSRVAVLLNPGNPFARVGLDRIQRAAASMQVEIIPFEIRSREDIERAIPAMIKEKDGAFLYLPDSFFFQQRALMAQLALRHRIPSMGPAGTFPQAGALMSYGQNMEENYCRAAYYVHKLLNGATPAEIPVEQPTKLELIINKKTASGLGLTIPPELLVLADKVIE